MTTCMEWRGTLNENGYGVTRVNGKHWYVHRLAWVQQNGPIPPATPCVLHRCDNRKCYNVEHLFLGTRRQNSVDMVRKGRNYRPPRKTACLNGHDLTDPTNIYRAPNGAHHCRQCRRERDLKQKERRRLANKTAGRIAASDRTHCRFGHPLSGENLYRYPSGARACRTCRKRWTGENRARRSATAKVSIPA